ncbi:hypothetical protein P3T76_012773 [Phytophthora citrophthora]|uniref:Uncharacterized protein n=1 Tax=Phytophthora citrophthora TaxID=4793 RepID=A0AAD9G4V9_9STRA|nr:hypothetical protein P3T76_012773 [Phytophthora citrophthora]
MPLISGHQFKNLISTLVVHVHAHFDVVLTELYARLVPLTLQDEKFATTGMGTNAAISRVFMDA